MPGDAVGVGLCTMVPPEFPVNGASGWAAGSLAIASAGRSEWTTAKSAVSRSPLGPSICANRSRPTGWASPGRTGSAILAVNRPHCCTINQRLSTGLQETRGVSRRACATAAATDMRTGFARSPTNAAAATRVSRQAAASPASAEVTASRARAKPTSTPATRPNCTSACAHDSISTGTFVGTAGLVELFSIGYRISLPGQNRRPVNGFEDLARGETTFPTEPAPGDFREASAHQRGRGFQLASGKCP